MAAADGAGIVVAIPPIRLGGQATAAVRRSLRVPRFWGLRPTDVTLIVFANAALIVAMWVRHGQLPNLGNGGAVLSAAGQLTALLGTYSALVQVVLMSRSPWLDPLFGIDRIAGWHRWLGFATVYLICAHVVFTTAGYAVSDGRSFLPETVTFLTHLPLHAHGLRSHGSLRTHRCRVGSGGPATAVPRNLALHPSLHLSGDSAQLRSSARGRY